MQQCQWNKMSVSNTTSTLSRPMIKNDLFSLVTEEQIQRSKSIGPDMSVLTDIYCTGIQIEWHERFTVLWKTIIDGYSTKQLTCFAFRFWRSIRHWRPPYRSAEPRNQSMIERNISRSMAWRATPFCLIDSEILFGYLMQDRMWWLWII